MQFDSSNNPATFAPRRPLLRRLVPVALCLVVIATSVWLGQPKPMKSVRWIEIEPGLLRTARSPFGYALVDGKAALLVNAPRDAEGLAALGVETIEVVLLTHHDRDLCAAAADFVTAKVPVRAPKAAIPWLEPEAVKTFWKEKYPLYGSNVGGYRVVPVGVAGLDFTIEPGQTIDWRGWKLEVVAAPGHAKDQVAYVGRNGKRPIVFCGDALAAPGKLWAPYTTDWDHVRDEGLKAAENSLRKLAVAKPRLLLPAHGVPIVNNCVAALQQTADVVHEAAFMKSFERYTKERVGNPPVYELLAADQLKKDATPGWSKVSEHLYLFMNTYVLISKEKKNFLVFDPWAERGAKQVEKLREELALGALEVVMFSHAHNDHFDGVHYLPGRDKFQVWSLDLVSGPIADPARVWAPFLDKRTVKFHRLFTDGATADWREYKFRFFHLPGQSEFTMGVEAIIDGKKCWFDGDNFFHQDYATGSGGWMGYNRSFPSVYAKSARKILDAAPDWVLHEHGGPYVFNAEDYRRRVAWGEAAARAADALCPSGQHRRDWHPLRIRLEPFAHQAKTGATLKVKLVAENTLNVPEKLTAVLLGRGLVQDRTIELELAPGATARRDLTLALSEKIPAGRHVFELRVQSNGQPDPGDAVVVIDVTP